MTDEVLFSVEGQVGRVSLNRPKAIHSLNLPMIEAMTEKLLAWEDDDAIAAVIIDHAEGRGFCAGGDVVALYNSAKAGDGAGAEFFYEEYRLNHLLFSYAKPVIAFMDGIVMGGGVGISQPATYRIATENTRFAMPETGIGLFPDVGGGWYLSRMPGRTGQFVGLTGARLDGAEALSLGLATHYLPAASLEDVKARIAADPSRIKGILSSASETAPKARIDDNRQQIDRLFASDTLEEILDALEQDESEWAAKELATLRTKSPLSMKVALAQLARSAKLDDFAENMEMEYRIGSRQYVTHDFVEGVRALLIDKDQKPVWNPATPEGVDAAMIDEKFEPAEGKKWTTLR